MTDEIVTYSGIVIRPLDPDPELIFIEDIAHALSNSCRFTGHVREFYSVAQHAVLCSQLVSPENKLLALLHDASEAYLSDIARPVKIQPGFGEVYRAAEDALMHAVSVRFGLEWPMPDEVSWADDVLLRTEQRDLMPTVERLRVLPDINLPTIDPWLPKEAEQRFLDTYDSLAHSRLVRDGARYTT